MTDPTPVVVLGYAGGEPVARSRAWVTMGILGVVVAAVLVVFNAAASLSAVRVLVAADRRASVALPRPLTAAEANAVVAALPAPARLTPPQAAGLARRLQAPGQCYSPVPVVPGRFPTAVKNGDGTVQVYGSFGGSGFSYLRLDAAGRVTHETASVNSADGTTTVDTDAAGRTTTRTTRYSRAGPGGQLAAAAALSLVSAADVAVGVWLLVVAVQLLRRAPAAVGRARRWAQFDLAAVAAFTAALLGTVLASGPPRRLSFDSPELLMPLGIAAVASVYPLAVLALARGSPGVGRGYRCV